MIPLKIIVVVIIKISLGLFNLLIFHKVGLAISSSKAHVWSVVSLLSVPVVFSPG